MSRNSNNHERMNGELEARDLSDPKQVWEDGALSPVPSALAPRTGMLGRVADAGDLADGNPTPYTLEVQAEILSRPTKAEDESPIKKAKGEH